MREIERERESEREKGRKRKRQIERERERETFLRGGASSVPAKEPFFDPLRVSFGASSSLDPFPDSFGDPSSRSSWSCFRGIHFRNQGLALRV